jgi:uncharacterized OsmC-like protein
MEPGASPARVRGNLLHVHLPGSRAASKFDFLSLELSGSGTVDREDGSTRFTDIVVKSRLTVPKGTDLERARRMLEKGKSACLVTASLSVPVRLESEIVVESAQGPTRR